MMNIWLCLFLLGLIQAQSTIDDSKVTIHTPDKYMYQNLSPHGFDFTKTTSLTFSVRACNDAHIGLFSSPAFRTRTFYEIVIGGWGNRQSVIRNYRQGKGMAVFKGILLNCKEKRPFWITWENGVIKVGRGNDVGVNMFMSWADKSPYKVAFVGISTGWGSDADWEFEKTVSSPEDSTVTIHTPDKYMYQSLSPHGFDFTKTTSLTFSVRACNDAHIGLFSSPAFRTRAAYEIVIGGWGNRQSVIRKYRQGRGMAVFKGILLNCKEKRPFWITWENGVIKVGRGNDVGVNMFMSWADKSPYKVAFVGISTGWGSDADWEFEKTVSSPEDSTVTIHTPDKYMYQSLSPHGFDFTKTTSLTFSVRACNDAHIGLFSSPAFRTKAAYEIVIGGWGNRQSVIRKYRQGRGMAVFKGILLNCKEKRPFWITWENGVIKVGRGNDVGVNMFMSWADKSPYKVAFVGISTGWGSDADWEFEKSVWKMGFVEFVGKI